MRLLQVALAVGVAVAFLVSAFSDLYSMRRIPWSDGWAVRVLGSREASKPRSLEAAKGNARGA